jgi:UDP-glucuronate decarboxylase
MQRQPDIARAKDKLGWTPKVELREGLVQTIEYFRNLAAWQVALV